MVDGGSKNLKCKYYEKALCLRDDHDSCEDCPYFRQYVRENRKRS